MRRLARWHGWLGWLIGVPLAMWTLTGLMMVARPIEEVRGEHLRIEQDALLPPGNPRPISFPIENPVRYTQMRTVVQADRAIWLLTTANGTIERYPADMLDVPLPEIDADFVRQIVEQSIVGGDAIEAIERFSPRGAPIDFRRPVPSWRAELADGTHVYVDAQSGEIAAVRTRFWRVFDLAWGLHIMDLETREDSSHPILIAFAALSAIGVLLGIVLLFRRRCRVD